MYHAKAPLVFCCDYAHKRLSLGELEALCGHLFCNGINTLYTERYTRSAFLYRYIFESLLRRDTSTSDIVGHGLTGKSDVICFHCI
jgi:hypothetical protein